MRKERRKGRKRERKRKKKKRRKEREKKRKEGKHASNTGREKQRRTSKQIEIENGVCVCLLDRVVCMPLTWVGHVMMVSH